jgi:hypothetical protein
MRAVGWIALVVVGLVVLGGRPAAQAQTPAAEVGLAVGVVATQTIDFEGEGLSSGAGTLRVSVPLTPRFAVEGEVMVAPGGQNCCYKQYEAFYTVQVRQRLARDRGPGLFLTYGAAGYLARERYPAVAVQLPDGTVVSRPAESYANVTPPFFTSAGIGFDQPVGSRLSVRADVQSISVLWLPLGVRGSAGVSIGFGRR